MNFKLNFPPFMRKRSFKYGVPFISFMVIGSFGLREFTELRYRYKKTSTTVRDELIASGVEMKKSGEVTIETEYEKMKQIDIDNWENKRIERPWDENENAK